MGSSDFWLFLKLKEQLKERRFNSDGEVEEAVGAAIQTIPQEEFGKLMDR